MASTVTNRRPKHQQDHHHEQPRHVPQPTILNDPLIHATETTAAGSILELLSCVAGIYTSFLTWAYLQERITTTPYGPTKLIFRSPLFINTIQSLLATLSGTIYLSLTSTPLTPQKIFPTIPLTLKLLLISVTQSLASPFGYAALSHIDYITYILAKSCKLLPVMFLHLTLFRKSYPFYKYAVVASVTAGVALFTLYHPSSKKHNKNKPQSSSSAWGLLLLSINLLFDGLTNSMQDHIFSTSPTLVSGPQMMVALNLLSTILTSTYLALNPYSSELTTATSFIKMHPRVLYDILGFAACGALGQVFIFHTLSRFGSLVLVTVTVTRKMFSMILSVLAFGHRLSGMQWVGVGFVFGGIGAEAEMKRRSEIAKREARRKRMQIEEEEKGKRGLLRGANGKVVN